MFKAMSSIALVLCLLIAAASVYADTSIINVYDANGNLISGDGKYYEYNDANQLAMVRQGDQSGVVIAEYFYDAAGQRIKKIESGVITYYIGKHFETQAGGANEGNSSYYFADGERVAKKDPAGNIYYYHLNHIGSTTAVTDKNGSLYGTTITYTPFGEIREATGSEKYSYTGKEKDKTDLYYFDARYNSPEFRHFTQADIEDPDLDDPQDLNRYSYVGNNLLSYVDPDGMKRRHLSKREQRALSLGKNPDKSKKWAGKLTDREYKRLLKSHLKHKAEEKLASLKLSVAKSSKASGAKYSLANNGRIEANDPHPANNNPGRRSNNDTTDKLDVSCATAIGSLYRTKDQLRDDILCFLLPTPTLGTGTLVKAGAESVGTALGCPKCATGVISGVGVSLGVSYYLLETFIGEVSRTTPILMNDLGFSD